MKKSEDTNKVNMDTNNKDDFVIVDEEELKCKTCLFGYHENQATKKVMVWCYGCFKKVIETDEDDDAYELGCVDCSRLLCRECCKYRYKICDDCGSLEATSDVYCLRCSFGPAYSYAEIDRLMKPFEARITN